MRGMVIFAFNSVIKDVDTDGMKSFLDEKDGKWLPCEIKRKTGIHRNLSLRNVSTYFPIIMVSLYAELKREKKSSISMWNNLYCYSVMHSSECRGHFYTQGMHTSTNSTC